MTWEGGSAARRRLYPLAVSTTRPARCSFFSDPRQFTHHEGRVCIEADEVPGETPALSGAQLLCAHPSPEGQAGRSGREDAGSHPRWGRGPHSAAWGAAAAGQQREGAGEGALPRERGGEAP